MAWRNREQRRARAGTNRPSRLARWRVRGAEIGRGRKFSASQKAFQQWPQRTILPPLRPPAVRRPLAYSPGAVAAPSGEIAELSNQRENNHDGGQMTNEGALPCCRVGRA